MPRIPHSLLLRAYTISPLLPLVLRATRTLPSAIRELRWLDEHVKQDYKSPRLNKTQQKQRLVELCRRRERGEPLQYILGSQPFGELDIKCRPGVLIPRPETEAYTTYLAKLVLEGHLHQDLSPEAFDLRRVVDGELQAPRRLRILDLCSGSGCISLLLYSLLSKRIPNIQICGYDISEEANKLSLKNLRDAEKNNFKHRSSIEFRQVDIFTDLEQLRMEPEAKTTDIIISNPPYISHQEFYKSTARSVRNFEPKIALVPKGREPGHDLRFFRRLISLHNFLKSRVLIMETSGKRQCLEVAQYARQVNGDDDKIEIWRDWPGQEPLPHEVEALSEGHPEDEFPVRGSGSYRSVVLIRH